MSSRPLRVAILAAAALIGSARSADASSFVESFVGRNFGCGTPAACPIDGVFDDLLSISTTNLLSRNSTNPIVTFSAQAQSTYGSLHAAASASFNLVSAADSRFILAGSLFRELLTINSTTQDGLPGTVMFTFDVDGTVSTTGVGNAFAFVGVQAGTVTNPEAFGESFTPILSTFNGTITLTVPMIFGQPFLFTVALGAVAGTVELCPACPMGITQVDRLGAGTGSAQFFNTLQLTGLTPMTTGGAFVGDSRFLSESGTPYGFTGVVPEPSTWLLLAGGLAVAASQWRRRQVRP